MISSKSYDNAPQNKVKHSNSLKNRNCPNAGYSGIIRVYECSSIIQIHLVIWICSFLFYGYICLESKIYRCDLNSFILRPVHGVCITPSTATNLAFIEKAVPRHDSRPDKSKGKIICTKHYSQNDYSGQLLFKVSDVRQWNANCSVISWFSGPGKLFRMHFRWIRLLISH